MSEEGQAQPGQEAGQGAQGQQAPQTPPPPPPQPKVKPEKLYTKEELDAEIEKRTKKPLSDMEALQKKYQELADRIRESDLMTLAAKAGAMYPDAAAKLVPEDAEDLEAAVAEIKRQYPALFHPGSADGGAGQEPEQLRQQKAALGEDMNARLRAQTGRRTF